MPHSPRIVAHTLVRTFVAGIATGLRSQIPAAVIVQSLPDGNLARGDGPIWLALRQPASRWVTLALAGGELVGDKLPMTPNRIDGLGGPFRIGTGATIGTLVASGLGAKSGGLAFAALSGAAGAAVGTYVGFFARTGITARYGLPDLPVALVEDVCAYALARLAIAKEL